MFFSQIYIYGINLIKIGGSWVLGVGPHTQYSGGCNPNKIHPILMKLWPFIKICPRKQSKWSKLSSWTCDGALGGVVTICVSRNGLLLLWSEKKKFRYHINFSWVRMFFFSFFFFVCNSITQKCLHQSHPNFQGMFTSPRVILGNFLGNPGLGVGPDPQNSATSDFY